MLFHITVCIFESIALNILPNTVIGSLRYKYLNLAKAKPTYCCFCHRKMLKNTENQLVLSINSVCRYLPLMFTLSYIATGSF